MLLMYVQNNITHAWPTVFVIKKESGAEGSTF